MVGEETKSNGLCMELEAMGEGFKRGGAGKEGGDGAEEEEGGRGVELEKREGSEGVGELVGGGEVGNGINEGRD